jgi:Protein of unknown function (DUF6044)
MASVERLRGGVAPALLYALLALFSFPTLGQVIAGEHGLGYVVDVFELPRTAILDAWPRYGLTLWDPHLAAGNALLAQQAIPPFALDVAIGLIAGPFAGYAVVGWLLAALGGWVMHLFLRDALGLTTPAVLGGSIIYLFSFWIFIYGAAGLALPLGLWLIDRATIRESGRWRFILAGAIFGGLLLYHSLSQIVLIAAGVQLAYVLFTSPAGGRWARIGVWSATWALALGMYAPILVTQMVMIPISHRTVWDLQALYDPRPLQALRDTIGFYSPTFLGVPLGGDIGVSAERYGTYFLGAIGLPLLAVGVVWGRRTPRTWFVLLLLIAIPLVDLVGLLLTPSQEQLGVLKTFQVVRVRHVFPFALAANAALGLDVVVRWWTGDRPQSPRGGWRTIVVAASFVPLVLATGVAGAQVVRRRRDLLELDTVALGWALLLVTLLIGAAVVVVTLVALWRSRRKAGHRRLGTAAVLAVLLLLASERALYAHGERFVGPYVASWSANLDLTPGQAFLLEQPGIDRERVLAFEQNPNRLAAGGLLQADGYQAVYPLTYHRYFGALIDPQLDTDPVAATYYRKWGNRAITFGPLVDPELVALAGVRWLYVRGDEVPSVPDAATRFEDGDVTIYEAPSVLPRAFLAGVLRVERGPLEVIDALAAADLASLRGTAFVADGPDADTLGSLPRAEGGEVGDEAGTATIQSITPDRVEIGVAADGPAVLVLTDVMAPGWIAERDGVAVPIATVDGAFRGVAVDGSTSNVVFRYVPSFTYLGFMVAGLSLLAALVWAWLVRRGDGRPVERSSTLSPPPQTGPGGDPLEDR